MNGSVSASLEATLPLLLRAETGEEILTVVATIDTGFTEFLLIPRRIISLLRLPVIERDAVVLGDGSTALLDVHAVQVAWSGGWQEIEAYAGEEDALIGVSLLEGHDLFVHFAPGGEVRVLPFAF